MIRALHLRRAIKAHSPENASILDAGCDTGRDAIYFAAKYPNSHITAVDINEEAINEAKKMLAKAGFGNVSFQRMDLLEMKYVEQFDLIYSVEVLEHITNYRRCVGNFWRALKPAGKLLVHVPCPDQHRHFEKFENMSYPDHVHAGFRACELVKLLKSDGFRILDVRYTFGWFGSLAWEIFEILRKTRFFKRALFPMVLAFAFVDTITVNRKGNGIMAIAKKGG